MVWCMHASGSACACAYMCVLTVWVSDWVCLGGRSRWLCACMCVFGCLGGKVGVHASVSVWFWLSVIGCLGGRVRWLCACMCVFGCLVEKVGVCMH